MCNCFYVFDLLVCREDFRFMSDVKRVSSLKRTCFCVTFLTGTTEQEDGGV